MNPTPASTAIVVERHEHVALVHDHFHPHVTHYFLFGDSVEHLISHHQHDHDHAAVVHEHGQHQSHAEHEREAHIHDHSHSVE